MTLIRFDENLSYRIPNALRELRLPPDITIETPAQADEQGLDDVDWITAFAARGGRCVVSGDEKMRDRPPERAALESAGLIAIFPPEGRFWMPLSTLGQAAFLIRWFPVIAELARSAEPGAHFRLPGAWTTISAETVRRLSRITNGE
ncbi:MAG: hypothetical protein Q7J28_04610 [Caulobacter sp.]|nr:hypothetical protein [Caulobacter sp.]